VEFSEIYVSIDWAIVVALIAVLVSVLTKVDQRKLQRESIDLQKSQSKLAEKQLELIESDKKIKQSTLELQRAQAKLSQRQLESFEKEEAQKLKASVRLDLRKTFNSSYKFFLSNDSEQNAKDVSFELNVPSNYSSPLIGSEMEEKLPISVLGSGSDVSFIAALCDDTPLGFNATITWTNPNGSQSKSEVYVSA
jgi:ABC-type multidrug transport system fused ATPase/permease subunit